VAIGHDGVVDVDPTVNPIYQADLHSTPALAQASASPPHLRRGVFHSLHT